MSSPKHAKTRRREAAGTGVPPPVPRQKEPLQGLLGLASEWYWEQDAHYRFTRITGAAFERSGFNAQDFLGTTRWDHGAVPVGDGGNWEKHKAALEAREPFSNFLFMRTDAKGAVHYVSSSGQPLFDAHGRFIGYQGVASDITARRRDERLLALEHTVNRCLATTESLASALKAALGAVCESEGWECGRYFAVDEKARVLHHLEDWGIPDPVVERYLAASRERVLPLDRGLKGRTYSLGEPLWGPDAGKHENTAKTYLGAARDCFFIPATAEGKVIGVICFTNRVVREPDARLLQAARVIGSQIGQFVQRKHAEEVLRESEARFRSLSNLSSDWFWEQDENLRFTAFSGMDRAVAGIDAAGVIGKTSWEIPGMAAEPAAQAVVQAKMQAREPFYDFEYKQTVPDGSLLYIIISGTPVFDTAGRFTGYRGVAKNITARRRSEQALALEHAVNRCLADADNVTAALKAVIRIICETQNWQCGRYFHLDEDAGLLRFNEFWSAPGANLDAFIAKSRQVTYAPGVGLAGKVWQSGQPLWVVDVAKDDRTPYRLGGAPGLHGGIVFPIISEGKTIGVVTCAGYEASEPDERLLQALRVVGTQVGQFVQRKHAEEVLRENEARFRSLAALSADVYWEQDAEYRFTSFTRRGPGRHSASENEFIGKKRWETNYVNMTADAWAAHITMLDARQPFHDLELCRLDAGKKTWVSVSGHPVFDKSGVFKGYRGVGKNITVRKRDDELLALEHAVNRCLADAGDVSTTLKAVIRAICQAQSWACGRYFHLDKEAGVLRYEEFWSAPGANLDDFITRSRAVTYTPGFGLAGKVWQSGKPIWVDDVTKHARMTPHGIARNVGLRGTFLFPVTAEGQVVGVLTFICREVREPDERTLQAVRVIGSQVGQFVQRKRTEQAALRLGRMFAALSATNDAIVHAKSPEELYQKVCDAAVHGGNFSNTSILIAEPGSLRMKVVAGAGRMQQYLRELLISVDENIPEGQGLTGIAFRTQRACVSNDFLNDECTQPWHESGRKAGCRAAAALPLIQGGRSVGTVLIHYDELNAFDDETVKLLERMAENVSFALDNFEHEAERQRSQERIQYLATHDGLTDLPNRVLFSQMLNLAIQSARRYGRHFAVLFLDLDRFKIINDTLGHDAGDTLLQEMSRRLKETLRASDLVARLGGDEFVVLLQEVTAPEQVAAVARKLLSAVIKPVVIAGQECRVTASIGISLYPSDAQDEQTLMKNADVAMYLAKEEGKNNFRFYSKDIKAQSLERLTLETSLRRALERKEFYLHYQAKLDLKTGNINGVEALVRWQHPDLGLVSPAQFIPLAEETGLIVQIGRWVLRTACAQNVAWQRAGLPPVCMAVNLSPRQFSHDELLPDLANVLQETGMDPGLLELEITESMVMSNVDKAANLLAAIKKMGVRLAIDDFGTGYSSLAQIKRFPIDTIKVDRSFIREIPQDAEDKAITQAIIAMGKTLSLTVVAEGVETQEQQAFLREHACDEMQGYYFSRPGTAEEFAALLRKHSK